MSGLPSRDTEELDTVGAPRLFDGAHANPADFPAAYDAAQTPAATRRTMKIIIQGLFAQADTYPVVMRLFPAVARGAEKTLEAVGGESLTLKALGGHPQTHPLGETYYSQVPILYGDYMAKVQVAPVAPGLTALTGSPVDLDDRPDGLRDAVVAHFATQGGEWELRAQLCTDLERMP